MPALPISLPAFASGAAARPRTTRGQVFALLFAVVGLFALLGLLNATDTIPIHIGLLPSGEGAKSEPSVDTILDAPVTDDIHEDVTPWRNFDEPNYALLTSKQPHEYGCPVSLSDSAPSPLAFIGVFSTHKRKTRRDIFREKIIPMFPKDLFEIKFILGMDDSSQWHSADDLQRSPALEEAKIHGDMVFLDIEENIDFGKTYAYFKWAAQEWGGEGQVEGRPRFVLKADDDTILVMPNLVSILQDLDCSKNIYFGTTAGASPSFKSYFRGLGYGLSWPLVAWIGNTPMSYEHRIKVEDARTGEWLRSLDRATDPLVEYDFGWTMGDWNQMDVSRDTVALHWLKRDSWVYENLARLEKAWAEQDQPFTPDNGVARDKLIDKGQWLPWHAMDVYLGNRWDLPEDWKIDEATLAEVRAKHGIKEDTEEHGDDGNTE